MSDLDPITQQPPTPDQNTKSDDMVVARNMNKKIIVCCDGTGNEFMAKAPLPTDTDGNSNVVKLYTALDLSPTQIAYYHPGVGTMGDPSKTGIARWWSKVKGLAFGWGFQDNVLDAYRYLMQHYNAGDEVYIFGFSRGAYTARALAGFLHGYGLLCRGNEGHILYAWNLYTAKLKKQRKQDDPEQTLVTDFAFRDTFSHADFMMHFVGLWDTVSSVGWVTTPLRLLHLAQNPSIITGRHAVSIDERRCFYHDNLWGKPVKIQVPPILKNTPRGDELNRDQDLVQVWFPGVHSDVGGSYGQLSSGLANGSLEWMMDQAEAAGALFKPQRQEAVLGEPVVNDPQGRTSVIQLLYPKPTCSKIHKSLKGPWWILEVFPHRYYNTDADKKEILRIPWGAWRRLPCRAMLHPSVLKEKECGGYKYASPNLTCGERRVISAGPWQGYGEFIAPDPKPDWRQNLLLVFAVKTALTAIPVLLLRPLLLWVLSLAERSRCAARHNAPPWVSQSCDGFVRHACRGKHHIPFWVSKTCDWLKRWVVDPGWVNRTHACSNHFVAAIEHSARVVGWSLLIAAAVVLFWTLVRLVKPRS